MELCHTHSRLDFLSSPTCKSLCCNLQCIEYILFLFLIQVRRKNTVRDLVSVAGFLHVTHLCMFTQTQLGVYLKLVRLPRGPTLTFKVHNYSLARDVVSLLKRQLVFEKQFQHSPLLVLNSFTGEGMQMKLMASLFQNMFPSINIVQVSL